MILLSCSNCWYNGLQYGALGLHMGFCVEHRVALKHADETTCGRQLRKDLDHASAVAANAKQRAHYSRDHVVHLRVEETRPTDVDRDTHVLRRDPVGQAVESYGTLGAKIESLAILRATPGARAELARLSLSRSYVHRCVSRRGRWTAGIHLFWWTKLSLAEAPIVLPNDLRHEPMAVSLERHAELAQWSVVMLRLLFLADVGGYARIQGIGNGVSRLADLHDEAAAGSGDVSLDKLLRWIQRDGKKRVDEALPYSDYAELAQALHRARP